MGPCQPLKHDARQHLARAGDPGRPGERRTQRCQASPIVSMAGGALCLVVAHAQFAVLPFARVLSGLASAGRSSPGQVTARRARATTGQSASSSIANSGCASASSRRSKPASRVSAKEPVPVPHARARPGRDRLPPGPAMPTPGDRCHATPEPPGCRQNPVAALCPGVPGIAGQQLLEEFQLLAGHRRTHGKRVRRDRRDYGRVRQPGVPARKPARCERRRTEPDVERRPHPGVRPPVSSSSSGDNSAAPASSAASRTLAIGVFHRVQDDSALQLAATPQGPQGMHRGQRST